MHTLHLVKNFTPAQDITVAGRIYKAGVPLCQYVHKATARTFIMPYDGPFILVKNPQFHAMLVGIGMRSDLASQLSGWYATPHNTAQQSFTQPVKPIVLVPGSPIVPPLPKAIQPQKPTNQEPTMAKKSNKKTAAASTPAPAAPAAPVPPVPPAPPVPPVAGAPVPPVPPVPPAAPPVPPAPPVAAEPRPAVPPAPPKVVEPTQNGLTRPTAGTQTRSVWDLADSLTAQNGGKPATRAAVVAAAVAAGTNASTATTQFGRWAKFNGFAGEKSPGRAPTAAKPAAPAAAPAPVPAGQADPAFTAGYQAYQAACRGETVGNPYTAGTPEVEQFTAGWNQAAADAQVAAAQ